MATPSWWRPRGFAAFAWDAQYCSQNLMVEYRSGVFEYLRFNCIFCCGHPATAADAVSACCRGPAAAAEPSINAAWATAAAGRCCMLLPLLMCMSFGYLLSVLLMKLQQPLLLLFLPLLLSPPLARAGRQHLHEIHKGKSAVPLLRRQVSGAAPCTRCSKTVRLLYRAHKLLLLHWAAPSSESLGNMRRQLCVSAAIP
jgi:hypothetical protein